MNLYKLRLLLLTATILTSCAKMPENERLDGQWQLLEIYKKSSPEEAEYSIFYNKKDEQIYWRFQLELMEIYTPLSNMNGYTAYTTARFAHIGNQLKITDTYIHFHDKDSLITDTGTNIFSSVGIDGNTETFQVEKLDRTQMTLSNKCKKLTFRKF